MSREATRRTNGVGFRLHCGAVGRSSRHRAIVVAATAAALLMPGSALAEKKFTSGVTAGEVTAHSAIIWARAAREGPVRAQVAKDGSFQHVVVARALRASDSNNDTVQTTIGGLNADQTYHYRF